MKQKEIKSTYNSFRSKEREEMLIMSFQRKLVGPGRNKQMPAAGALMIRSWIEYGGWRKRKNQQQLLVF